MGTDAPVGGDFADDLSEEERRLMLLSFAFEEKSQGE
jgi:hypothetical protein